MSEKLDKKIESGREYRAMTMKVRAKEGNEDSYIVEGYATTFGTQYTLYDGRYYKIIEQVDAEAFNDCDMSDVIMQYDHEGRVFARNRNNTLSLKVDSKGLFITADLGGTDIGKQLYQEISGGFTDRMSFGFVVAEDKREYTEDHENDVETCLRTITKISKLYDVSAVSIPANDATSISARTLTDGLIQEMEAERLQREKRKRLKLLLEVSK